MMGLSEGERISMIRSAILIQYTRVTDRRTDGRTAWHIRATAYMLSRVKTIRKLGQNVFLFAAFMKLCNVPCIVLLYILYFYVLDEIA